MLQFKVAIEDQEARSHSDQQQREEEVLDEQGDELARADALVLNEEVVLALALLAVDALANYNVRGLAVSMDLLAWTFARLTELC